MWVLDLVVVSCLAVFMISVILLVNGVDVISESAMLLLLLIIFMVWWFGKPYVKFVFKWLDFLQNYACALEDILWVDMESE